MECVGFAPDATVSGVFYEAVPSVLRPMFNGVDQFVERERPGDGEITREKNRRGGKQPLGEREEGRNDEREDEERIPRKIGGSCCFFSSIGNVLWTIFSTRPGISSVPRLVLW